MFPVGSAVEGGLAVGVDRVDVCTQLEQQFRGVQRRLLRRLVATLRIADARGHHQGRRVVVRRHVRFGPGD